jgi:hypothetical protein
MVEVERSDAAALNQNSAPTLEVNFYGGQCRAWFARAREAWHAYQKYPWSKQPSGDAMKSTVWGPICAVVLSLATIPCARAQSANVPPDVKSFATQYVAAFNAKDNARLLSFNVPQSRACITPANRDVYDSVMAMQFTGSIPPNYILTLMPVNENNLKALADLEYFPVKPERELNIDYQYPRSNSGGQLVIWLVRQNGRWMGDFPCMTARGIKNFRDNAAARKRYKALAAEIKEPLRSQLVGMLRAHQIGEAEMRYQKATGSDMRTSMLVVNALQQQLR